MLRQSLLVPLKEARGSLPRCTNLGARRACRTSAVRPILRPFPASPVSRRLYSESTSSTSSTSDAATYSNTDPASSATGVTSSTKSTTLNPSSSEEPTVALDSRICRIDNPGRGRRPSPDQSTQNADAPVDAPTTNKSSINKSATNKSSINKSATNKSSTNKSSTNKSSNNKSSTNKSSTNKSSNNKSSTNKFSTNKSTAKPAPTHKDPVSVETLAQSEQILKQRPNLWLRDVCSCEKCVDPHSGQKSFATTQLDFLPEVRSVERGDDGSLTVVWANDPASGGQDHTSVYPPTIEDGFYKILRRDLWNREIFEKDRQECRVSYHDWIAGGSEFWDAMAVLARKGLIFVHDVPQGDEQAVERIGEQIGALQETFYGRTWDVVSKPQAENVAYTNQFLGLHQDLLYYPDPPRIQLLHCLANECDGGESLFSDGVYAAATIASKRHDTFLTLASQPTAYHYNKNGNVYYAERPLVKAGQGHAAPTLVDNVWWSPPFQAQFPTDHHKMANWYLAAKQFHAEIERPEHVVEHRLQAGECVVFDNWRVLHGRREFNSAAGKRHLKGTYVDDRTYRARYDDMPPSMARQHDLWTDRPTEHWRNQQAVRYGSRSQKVLAYMDDGKTRAAHTLLSNDHRGTLTKKNMGLLKVLRGSEGHRVEEQPEASAAS